jgi:signal transduction histidine kinase
VNFQFINSLQLKLALGFLLVSLAPLGIVGYFSVSTADQAIESIVSNQLQNLAAEKQQLLQRWIAERKADIEVVAGSSIIKNMDPATMEPFLRSVQSQYEVYQRFRIAGPDGRIIYDSSLLSDSPIVVQPWFALAMKGQRYQSSVYLDNESHLSVFQLATPICDAKGHPQGVLCATVNTAGILSRVLNISLGKTGECYLVDSQGVFLAHQNPERILHDNIAQSGSFANIFQRNQAHPIYKDYRGIAVLGASRDISGTEWYVVVEQDQDEAFAPSFQLRRNIRIAVVLTLLGAVGLSLWLAYYLASPIRALSEAAHALARGDYNHPLVHVKNHRRDEIGMLRNAFEHMADQIHAQHQTLETQVGMREVELQQTGERLEHTIQAAARSEHLAVLGRLASGVAHEIRTPLSSLKLYLQSVQEDFSVSPELGEDYDVAMRQVERIESTINHFLIFARPRDPVFASIDFARLVNDSIAIVRPRANQQNVRLTSTIAADVPEVHGDMRQLCDALVNLLVNALDELSLGGDLAVRVMPDGVKMSDNENATRWARIDVVDNGPGIQPSNLEILFEPFFTTKASGSGLGLPIVQGTVQRHNGIIRISTTPGSGTTFTILLPAATHKQPTQKQTAPEQTAPE